MRLFSLHIFAAIVLLSAGAHARQPSEPVDEARLMVELMQAGDPSAVPIITRWLDRAAMKPDENQFTNEFSVAVLCAGRYRLQEAGPSFVAIYRNPTTERSLKEGIASAAAEIRAPASKRFLEMLRDDRSLSERQHYQVLGALASLGDRAARDELFDLYRKFVTLEPSPEIELGFVLWVIQPLDDPEMISRLESLRDLQPDPEVKGNVDALIGRMKLNSMSADELLKLIRSDDGSKLSTLAFPAMSVVAEKGDVEVIGKISALFPPPKIPAKHSARYGHMFDLAQKEAIAKARRLHWRVLSAQPTTKP